MKVAVGSILCMLLAACSVKQKAFIGSYTAHIRKAGITMPDGVGNMYFHKKSSDSSGLVLFIVGGSGHSSAIYGLAYYAHALHQLHADVYMLQKRYVHKRETGMRKANSNFTKSYYFGQLVADQEYFISSIMAMPRNAHKNVLLLGVSEGGTVAAKIAAETAGIDYLAIIGSGGMKQRDEFRILYPSQREGLEKFYRTVQEYPSSDSVISGYTCRYWASFLFEDPMPYFLLVHTPILLGIGGQDSSVPVASARYLDSLFVQRHKENLTYVEYPGCDHTLKDDQGESHLPDFFSRLAKMASIH